MGWTEKDYDRIVGLIYDAQDNPDLWETVSNDVGDAMHGGVVHTFLADFDNEVNYMGVSPRVDPGFNDEYLRDYAHWDFRHPKIFSFQEAVAFDEREIVTPEEKRASPIHNELFVRHEINNILGSNLSVDGSAGWFGVGTLSQDQEFSDDAIASLNRILPHVWRSFKTLKTNTDLLLSSELSFSALDRANVGVLIFRYGKLVHINTEAKQILGAGFLSLRGERLAVQDPDMDFHLKRLFQTLHGITDTSLMLRRHETGEEFLINIHDPKLRYSAGRVHQSEHKIVSIHSSVNRKVFDFNRVREICKLFEITEAETFVVFCILHNRDLRQFAEERGIKLDTAQKQLKSAMKKLGVASQKQCVQKFERYL